MNSVSQNVMQVGIDLIVINKTEYNKLIDENNELKIKLTLLTNDYKTLEIIKENHVMTIELLKKENAELKSRIEALEQLNLESTSRVGELLTRISTLESEFNKLKNKSLFDKYMIAIQDLYKEEHLKTKINDQTVLKELKYLEDDRIENCHYLNRKYSNIDKDGRRYVLNEKIMNMSSDIKQMFALEYPTVLNGITPFIKKNNNVPSDITLEQANRWWE